MVMSFGLPLCAESCVEFEESLWWNAVSTVVWNCTAGYCSAKVHCHCTTCCRTGACSGTTTLRSTIEWTAPSMARTHVRPVQGQAHRRILKLWFSSTHSRELVSSSPA